MSKDQKKKIMLGGIGLAVLVYVYFTFFIGPLNRTRADIASQIVTTQEKTASSKADIEKARKIEQRAQASLDRSASLRTLNPGGAPIAWFPPRLKTFLASQHVDRASIRLESKEPVKETELDNWQRYSWLVDVPLADYHSFGRALADLENTEPLLTITRVRIHTAADDPEMQQITFAATTLIEKR